MTRTHYFDGRLLTAEDLERDQRYLDERLREVGKVLGHGILRGLDVQYDRFTGLLTVEAGLGVTPAGRVLQLSSRLLVDLGDRALISQLNHGRYRKFNRALFAIVLKYVEVATDVAEVFPTDLAAKRGADYALITESVQLGLVELPTTLNQQDPLHMRSQLIRTYLGAAKDTSDDGRDSGYLPEEDGVTLGVIAIANDSPQWLDSQLLRHPLRDTLRPGDVQADLSRYYESLFAEVLTRRQSGSLDNNFTARDYFDLLPPVGSLPVDAIDPVSGVQRFFPEHFDVHIAPIREAELPLIQAESMALPNIDLAKKDDADIVVLVPMSNADFGHYAGQLERDKLHPGPFNPGHPLHSRRLPQLDLLRLKLYPTRPVHRIDTDATVWQAIWDQLTANTLVYARRPVRIAETSVSGIVLAQGFTPPAPVTPPINDTPPTPTPGDGGNNDGGNNVIEDEDTVFLRMMNFKHLAEMRPPSSSESDTAFEQLLDNFGNDARIVRQSAAILLKVERYYDPVIWQTLRLAAETDGLQAVIEAFQDLEPDITATGRTIVNMADDLRLPRALTEEWETLAERIGRRR
ncbi:hypothetical protein [Marinibactrum halimedae]|nr:hypothetical protein [Marinibactrum halimedae]MCD9460620.1 hypothetical protein [Marinibactrum halimedae]